MSSRLDQLAEKSEDLARRALSVPAALVQAEAAFVEALRVGAPADVVEAFRVQCATLYEAKLDLIAEAAQVQRDLMEEARRGPQL